LDVERLSCSNRRGRVDEQHAVDGLASRERVCDGAAEISGAENGGCLHP
jgi:hypothetical protein